MRRGKCLRLGVRSSSMPSSFFTTAFSTFRLLRHSFDAEYLTRATGWMKSCNTRWILSFLYVSRDVVTVLDIFPNFLPTSGCSRIAKRVALQTGNEPSIGRLFLLLRLSVAV